ncbi:MAG: tryptophan synthase subunit alpha [Bacteroidaceae bacterium]|nr:tryptophan synthase subunit alpha [Bacteroidaceae bacterium]
MNKINKLFAERGDNKLLSLYFCAGSPTLEGTGDVIKTMQRRGIDLIEVGIPFSDPLADGPVIQTAATKALSNGMSLKTLFAQLKAVKEQVHVPLILMGYLNPILHYGIDRLPCGRAFSRSPEQTSSLWSRSIEAFCQSCADAGVSGMIIPDLPFDDYLSLVKPAADKYDLRVVMLITPETSDERIRFIDDNTDGFIYMVSSAAITGTQENFDEQKQAYFRRIDAMNLRNPRMIGFGISNAQTLKAAQDNAAGAIIGSKFVTLLDQCDGNADLALDRLFEALGQ